MQRASADQSVDDKNIDIRLNVATQRCRWRDNWHTIGTSNSVLSRQRSRVQISSFPPPFVYLFLPLRSLVFFVSISFSIYRLEDIIPLVASLKKLIEVATTPFFILIIAAFPFALSHVVINPFFPTSLNGITLGYFAVWILCIYIDFVFYKYFYNIDVVGKFGRSVQCSFFSFLIC